MECAVPLASAYSLLFLLTGPTAPTSESFQDGKDSHSFRVLEKGDAF